MFQVTNKWLVTMKTVQHCFKLLCANLYMHTSTQLTFSVVRILLHFHLDHCVQHSKRDAFRSEKCKTHCLLSFLSRLGKQRMWKWRVFQLFFVIYYGHALGTLAANSVQTYWEGGRGTTVKLYSKRFCLYEIGKHRLKVNGWWLGCDF